VSSPPAPAPEPESSAVARRAGLVGVGILVSRFLGALRDVVIAATFAVGLTDAFFMAFTIPNALRVLFGEGAASGAFVPVLTEAREREGNERAATVFGGLMRMMVPILALVTLLGIVFASPVVLAYASGFDAERFELTVEMTRWVFPYIFLMGVAALVTAALHSRKSFTAPALSPALLNVALVLACLLAVPALHALGLPAWYALAGGVLVGGVLQVAAQWPALRRLGFALRAPGSLRDPYVRKAMRLLAPLLLSLGVYQLNLIFSRQFASYLGRGPVSWLWYAQRLVEIPQGMFALAIASAALPSLSEIVARGDREQGLELFRATLRMTLFVAIPSTVALAVLALPIVAVLFGHGAFSSTDVQETAYALVFLAAGIWAIAAVRTVVPMFHAHNDTKAQVVASLMNLVVFATASWLLMDSMRHAGLTLATSLAGVAQLGVLLALLRRRTGRLGLGRVVAASLRMGVASAAMGGVLFALTFSRPWLTEAMAPVQLVLLTLSLVLGGLCYLGVAHVLGVEEASTFTRGVLRRVRRKRAERQHYSASSAAGSLAPASSAGCVALARLEVSPQRGDGRRQHRDDDDQVDHLLDVLRAEHLAQVVAQEGHREDPADSPAHVEHEEAPVAHLADARVLDPRHLRAARHQPGDVPRGHPADAGARAEHRGGSPSAHAGRVDRRAPRGARPPHERAARHRVRVANRAATRRSSAQTERRAGCGPPPGGRSGECTRQRGLRLGSLRRQFGRRLRRQSGRQQFTRCRRAGHDWSVRSGQRSA
jgi:putative peptidoglycan lipid II flippase